MSLINKMHKISIRNLTNCARLYCSKVNETIVEQSATSKGGFARAFEKYTAPATTEPAAADTATFASLLRNSKLIDLGDPEGKLVIGKIFHVVGNDLYIDFGWKLHCVCVKPTQNAADYVRGARVRLRIKDLELSTRFIGSQKDLTILEADCQLLGIISSPARQTTSRAATTNTMTAA